jgi:hypothetical protein
MALVGAIRKQHLLLCAGACAGSSCIPPPASSLKVHTRSTAQTPLLVPEMPCTAYSSLMMMMMMMMMILFVKYSNKLQTRPLQHVQPEQDDGSRNTKASHCQCSKAASSPFAAHSAWYRAR